MERFVVLISRYERRDRLRDRLSLLSSQAMSRHVP